MWGSRLTPCLPERLNGVPLRPESTGRERTELRLSPPPGKTSDVFPQRHRLADEIDERANERRHVSGFPPENDRDGRGGVIRQRPEADAVRRRRANGAGPQRA